MGTALRREEASLSAAWGVSAWWARRAGTSSLKRSSEPRSQRSQNRLKGESSLWRSEAPKHENYRPQSEKTAVNSRGCQRLGWTRRPTHRSQAQTAAWASRQEAPSVPGGDGRQKRSLASATVSGELLTERPSVILNTESSMTEESILTSQLWRRERHIHPLHFAVFICKARGWLFLGAFPAIRIKPLDI